VIDFEPQIWTFSVKKKPVLPEKPTVFRLPAGFFFSLKTWVFQALTATQTNVLGFAIYKLQLFYSKHVFS
jgi:hypothetical protein